MTVHTSISKVDRTLIIDIARQWIDTPYHHQGATKGAGSDCLGLIRGVWRELYGSEPESPPPYTPDWNERHQARWNQITGADPLLGAAARHLLAREDDDLVPGDVLIFRITRHGPAKHCGILSDTDRFIHAYAGRSVVEGWLNRWWRSRIVGVFSFPGSVPWHS